MGFDYLDSPIAVIGAYNWIVPPAEMENDYFPQAFSFLDAYHTQIKPLPGYEPRTDRSARAMLDTNRRGV